MLSKASSQLVCRSLALTVGFRVSRKSNYASEPAHPPTTQMWRYGDGVTSSQLRIAGWNVNGIRSVIDKGELQKYLAEGQPDILCVNETKIDLRAFKKNRDYLRENLRDYEWYWNFCKVSSGYSGVLILSKAKPIKAIEDFQCLHHMSRLEGRCLTLEYSKFYMVCCYKPNAGPELQRLEEKTKIYNKSLAKHIVMLKKTKPVLLFGDMNVAHQAIDLAKPKANLRSAGFTIEQRQSFTEMLEQTGLVDSFRQMHPHKVEYTYWSARAGARDKNVGWRLDYMLASDMGLVRAVQNKTGVMGSDHCPVEALVVLDKLQ